MPTHVFPEYRFQSRKKQNFGALYAALILLSLHWAVVLYINSSFLEQFVSGQTVGLLYTISSGLTILFFLAASRILTVIGNYTFILGLAVLECIALFGLAASDSAYSAIPLFIAHQAIVPLILFGLDIFMEAMIGTEEQATGGRRGLLLTIMSLTGALAALSSGYLVGDETPQFALAYISSALLLIPFIMIIMRFFKTFEDPAYPRLKIIDGFLSFWHVRDVRNVFFAHFLLQLFFSWMVIYTPIYLSVVVGLNWEQIGQVLFVGLMAYVFLEYPIGVIADRWIGEKEMMALGFLIMSVSISWFAFLGGVALIGWMLTMFMTRVGASFVETTTESYFFKHTEGRDTNLISFFRLTRPLSIVTGALIGSVLLTLLPFNLIFVVLGFLMIPGLFFTLALKDTK